MLILAGTVTQAAPIDLGAAGPAFWTVLQISDAKIDMSNSQGAVEGNVGVAAGGRFQSSGPSVNGQLILGEGAEWSTSGDAEITGGVTQNDLLLSQAVADAIFYSSFYDGLAATTSVSGGLITDSMVLNGGSGLNVLDLTKIELGNNEVLTLSAPEDGSWVINISDELKLNSGVIELAGGLTFDEVLFNMTGSGGANVSFSGGGNSSQLTGIVLSPNGKVQLSPGLVNGQIIAGDDISIVSGAQVINPIPLPPAIWMFGAALLCLLRLRSS